MSLTIEIEDYPVFVRIGWFESERKQGQEVLISLKAQLEQTTQSDSLSETTDYSSILEHLDKTLEDKEINLIETAVQLAGTAILEAFPQVICVKVTIEKQILPGAIAKGGKVKVNFFEERGK